MTGLIKYRCLNFREGSKYYCHECSHSIVHVCKEKCATAWCSHRQFLKKEGTLGNLIGCAIVESTFITAYKVLVGA